MKQFTAQEIYQFFDYQEFLPVLESFYRKSIVCPARQHFETNSKKEGNLLIMPAWDEDSYTGVKLVNVFPQNKSLPTINGIYLLMDSSTGETLASFDGLALTCKRTAAVSALASKYLSKVTTENLLVLGSGKMSGELVKAHAAVRDLKKIKLWGRNETKAQIKIEDLLTEGYPINFCHNRDVAIAEADLISTATLSHEPIVDGQLLKEGTHLDLVGSYQKTSREAINAVTKKNKIFVDTYQALKESGDILIPLIEGMIQEKDILSDLPGLVKQSYSFVRKPADITIFKSVGFASSDLAAAVYLYEKKLEKDS